MQLRWDRARPGRCGLRPRNPLFALEISEPFGGLGAFEFGARARRTTAGAAVLPIYSNGEDDSESE